MDDVLWYVLAGSRGGHSRVRIVQALAERPRNANELATELDLDYTTVRHHLDVLWENNVVSQWDGRPPLGRGPLDDQLPVLRVGRE